MPRFQDIVGQDRAHELLRTAARRERLPHAYLFHGAEGVGKTSTAFALARFLNCENPSETDSCGECRPCHKYLRFHHPDLHWIFPMAGSLKGGARSDHVRKTLDSLTEPGIHRLSYTGAAGIAIGRDEETRPGSVGQLRHEASLTMVEARVKVFVVTDAERMKAEAANSLLKVLEEPPPDNLLILTTQKPGQILDTIVSRCQSVRFRDLSEPEIVKLLIERLQPAPETKSKKKGKQTQVLEPPDPQSAALAAALAGGSLTHAHDFLEFAAAGAGGIVGLRDSAVKFLRLLPGDPRLHEAVDLLAKRKDRVEVARIIDFGLLWIGDLLRASTGADVSFANRDRENEIVKEARDISVEELRRRTRVLEEARRAMQGNVLLHLVIYGLVYGMAGTEAEYTSAP